MLILAIDPGVNGGAVALYDGKIPEVSGVWHKQFAIVPFKRRSEEKQLHDGDSFEVGLLLLRLVELGYGVPEVIMEDPPVYIPGRGPQHATKVGPLRESFGFWRGYFSGRRETLKTETPQSWMAGLEIPDVGDRKRGLALAATNMLPQLDQLNSTTLLKVCDAALLGITYNPFK